MTDMEELFRTVDKLSPAERDALESYLMADSKTGIESVSPDEDVESKIRGIQEAVNGFMDGFSQADIDQIVWAMNHEYVDPDDLHMFDWIDELPEDER
jgi:hypothetical protein